MLVFRRTALIVSHCFGVGCSIVPRASTMTTPRRSARNLKRVIKDEAEDKSINGSSSLTPPPSKRIKASPSPSPKKIKLEHPSPTPSPLKSNSSKHKTSSAAKKAKKEEEEEKKGGNEQGDLKEEKKSLALQTKKLSSYTHNTTPFPHFPHPTPQECRLAHSILANLHGDRVRPDVVRAPRDRAGCGDSPCVLDALVRTILSQNTSDKNSSRAKKSIDQVYGEVDEDEGSTGMEERWKRILEGGQPKLEDTIRSGGLANTKSRVIIDILHQVHDRHGAYSLDHLLSPEHSDDACMREMLSLKGVGPKTASCVLLFCLRRESFAVDTHVHRITGLLGWRPPGSSRDEAHAHLDAKIPGEEKYPLHVLIIAHGKQCEECKAGGKNLGKCELRKAFRKGKVEGGAGEDMKEEELDIIKKEKAKGVTAIS